MTARGGFDWRIAVHECLRACARCARCRWVSVSRLHLDCSWFLRCKGAARGSSLEHTVPGFLSGPSGFGGSRYGRNRSGELSAKVT